MDRHYPGNILRAAGYLVTTRDARDKLYGGIHVSPIITEEGVVVESYDAEVFEFSTREWLTWQVWGPSASAYIS